MQWLPRAFVLLTVAVSAATAIDADEPPPGITNPQDVIVARRALMTEMARLMLPIDAFSAGGAPAVAEQQSAALAIARMLVDMPQLFPPATDLYDANSATPVTLALPAVWQDFGTFSALAANAVDTARKLASANDPAELRTGALALRAACDACHAPFLRRYEADAVRSEDLEFDFDSVFEGDDAADATPAKPQ